VLRGSRKRHAQPDEGSAGAARQAAAGGGAPAAGEDPGCRDRAYSSRADRGRVARRQGAARRRVGDGGTRTMKRAKGLGGRKMRHDWHRIWMAGIALALLGGSAQAQDPVKIGFVTELTGPWSFFGTSCVAGLK